MGLMDTENKKAIRAILSPPFGGRQGLAVAVGMNTATLSQQLDCNMTKSLTLHLFHNAQVVTGSLEAYRYCLSLIDHLVVPVVNGANMGNLPINQEIPFHLITKIIQLIGSLAGAIEKSFSPDSPGGIEITDEELNIVNYFLTLTQTELEKVKLVLAALNKQYNYSRRGAA